MAPLIKTIEKPKMVANEIFDIEGDICQQSRQLNEKLNDKPKALEVGKVKAEKTSCCGGTFCKAINKIRNMITKPKYEEKADIKNTSTLGILN